LKLHVLKAPGKVRRGECGTASLARRFAVEHLNRDRLIKS
jgi:hypothetical protein